MIQLKKNLTKKCCWYITGICLINLLVVFLIPAKQGMANNELSTVADIALYRGVDREKILIEGAKKEGELIFYNSHTWLATLAREFEKKYPFIKVSVWRSDAKKILRRVTEEYTARRFLVDVINTSHAAMVTLRREGVLQEYYTPEARYYEDNVKVKGKNGLYYMGDREIYIGLGFNTKLIPSSEAPKTYEDLLNLKWKGKMAIAGTNTGIWWIGNILDARGREFIEKIKHQQVRVHTFSGAALANMVVAGEVPLSPTIYNSNIIVAKREGAHVEWRPLEPTVAVVGYSGITTKAAHPHSSMLFLDYIHSKKGQNVIIRGGLSSPRKDIGSLKQKFKVTYLEAKYPVFEDYKKQFNQWEKLLKELLLIKK